LLRKTQMMRIRKLPSADQTGLLNNKPQMGSVPLLTGDLPIRIENMTSLSEVSPGEKIVVRMAALSAGCGNVKSSADALRMNFDARCFQTATKEWCGL
jgi:hypothetical protein